MDAKIYQPDLDSLTSEHVYCELCGSRMELREVANEWFDIKTGEKCKRVHGYTWSCAQMASGDDDFESEHDSEIVVLSKESIQA